MYKIAVIIVTYNRPDALHRLLQSVGKAIFPENVSVPLIISIDYSGEDSCKIIADNFNWEYGEKEVIYYDSNLGLKEHILKCGDYSKHFDGIIMLEDDLYVSPWFYKYTSEAFSFIANNNQIAGISLYSYRYNEFADLSFEPIDDGYDNYYMQVPSSWGQFWSKEQWQAFREQYEIYKTQGDNCFKEEYRFPEGVLNWPSKTSWKKYFFKYIVANNKYIFFPRLSLTTNCGDPGEHFLRGTLKYHVPLQLREKNYGFSKVEESLSVYDYTMDISYSTVVRINPALERYSFEVDLYGLKNIRNPATEYYLSVRESSNPELGFTCQFYPTDLNILLNVSGGFFSLSKASNFVKEVSKEKYIQLAKSHIKGGEQAIFYEGVMKVKKSTSYKVGYKILSLFRPFLRTRKGDG